MSNMTKKYYIRLYEAIIVELDKKLLTLQE